MTVFVCISITPDFFIHIDANWVYGLVAIKGRVTKMKKSYLE